MLGLKFNNIINKLEKGIFGNGFTICCIVLHWEKQLCLHVRRNLVIHPDNRELCENGQRRLLTKGQLKTIGKTPVRIILWCPTTKMLIKACFLIQPLEQEGGCQKCCISLCSKVFINHFYQMKASPECLNILIYWSKYWVERLKRTLRI